MNRSPSFAGLIMAAGASSRMGQDKALLPWRGATFLAHAIASLSPLVDFVLVIAGANFEKIAPIAYSQSAFMIHHPRPQQGQFSSLRIGLNEILNRGRDAAIVTLVDRPAAHRDTVMSLKSEFLLAITAPHSDIDVWGLVPEYEGRHGHPYIAGRNLIEAFLRAPATSNAREVEHAHQAHVRYLPTSDPNVVANVDTPEQYRALGEELG
ncbi:MAG: NTP transferase domain-containing protein [Acidobacteriaceae bacterium]